MPKKTSIEPLEATRIELFSDAIGSIAGPLYKFVIYLMQLEFLEATIVLLNLMELLKEPQANEKSQEGEGGPNFTLFCFVVLPVEL